VEQTEVERGGKERVAQMEAESRRRWREEAEAERGSNGGSRRREQMEVERGGRERVGRVWECGVQWPGRPLCVWVYFFL